MERKLLVAGTLLLLFGLLLGTVLDWFASPVVAADAHVAGVQHGMLIMILALAWRYSTLGKLEAPCALLNVLGLYGIWAAFLLGAVLGDPYPSASTATYVIFVSFSAVLILGVLLFLIGLLRAEND